MNPCREKGIGANGWERAAACKGFGLKSYLGIGLRILYKERKKNNGVMGLSKKGIDKVEEREIEKGKMYRSGPT